VAEGTTVSTTRVKVGYPNPLVQLVNRRAVGSQKHRPVRKHYLTVADVQARTALADKTIRDDASAQLTTRFG
jgi:hypothetical protein